MPPINPHPLVSIILPTYNRATLLPRSINSVQAQTFTDWELIIWDDGSTDDTKKVVESFGDKRIRYFFDHNHGMSYALNQAIEHTRGIFIAFLDDDDVWKESKLTIQLELLTKYPEIDLVFGDFTNFNQVTGKLGIGFSQTAGAMKLLKTRRIAEHERLITGNFLEAIMHDNFIAFDTVIIRKSMVDLLGKFNEELRNGMDLEYWWRFGLMGGKAAYTESIIMDRIKYPQSLSGSNLLTLQNHLKALDSCQRIASLTNHMSEISILKKSYRNAWQNCILVHGKNGEINKALSAFNNSLKYGFRFGSLRLLMQVLLKPK